MANVWQRSHAVNLVTVTGSQSITSWPAGETMLRCHMRIQATLGAAQNAPTSNIASFELGVGVESVLSTTSTVPTPITSPTDHNPPAERWLYWRVVHFSKLMIASPTNSANSVFVGDIPDEDIDIKSQVLAPAGATTSLYLAYEPVGTIASDWHIRLAWWASVLV